MRILVDLHCGQVSSNHHFLLHYALAMRKLHRLGLAKKSATSDNVARVGLNVLFGREIKVGVVLHDDLNVVQKTTSGLVGTDCMRSPCSALCRGDGKRALANLKPGQSLCGVVLLPCCLALMLLPAPPPGPGLLHTSSAPAGPNSNL